MVGGSLLNAEHVCGLRFSPAGTQCHFFLDRQHQRTALPLLRSGSGCAILPLEPVVLGCVSRLYVRDTRSLLCLEGNGVLGAACVEGEYCFSFAPPSQLPINSGPLYRVGTPI